MPVEPNSYESLLEALGGDTGENRRLINDFAHQLAQAMQGFGILFPGMTSPKMIDPYEQTQEDWERLTSFRAARDTDGLHKPPKETDSD